MIQIVYFLRESFFSKSYKSSPRKTAKNRHFLPAGTTVLLLNPRKIPPIAKLFRHPTCYSAQGKATRTVKRPFRDI